MISPIPANSRGLSPALVYAQALQWIWGQSVENTMMPTTTAVCGSHAIATQPEGRLSELRPMLGQIAGSKNHGVVRPEQNWLKCTADNFGAFGAIGIYPPTRTGRRSELKKLRGDVCVTDGDKHAVVQGRVSESGRFVSFWHKAEQEATSRREWKDRRGKKKRNNPGHHGKHWQPSIRGPSGGQKQGASLWHDSCGRGKQKGQNKACTAVA